MASRGMGATLSPRPSRSAGKSKPLRRVTQSKSRVVSQTAVGEIEGLGNEAIEAVLWFRRRALSWYNLPRTAILAYHVHSEALFHFKNWFTRANLASRAWNSCAVFLDKSDTYGSQT